MGWGLLGAIGGFGKGMSDIADANIKQQNEMDLVKLRADTDLQKAQTLAKFNNDLTKQPGLIAGQYISNIDGKVPVQAQTVTSLPQDSASVTDQQTGIAGKFAGDISSAKADLEAAYKAGGLTKDEYESSIRNLMSQKDTAQQTANDSVAGKYRDMSDSERLDAAYKAAIAKGDVQSATEIKKLLTDQMMTIADGAKVIDKRTGAVIADNSVNKYADKEKLRELQAEKTQNQFEIAFAKLDALASKTSAGEKDPSIVATAKWLVSQNIAKTPEDAWHMAKSSSEKPQGQSDMDFAAKLMAANSRLKPEEAVAQVQAMRNAVGTPPTAKANSIVQQQAPWQRKW